MTTDPQRRSALLGIKLAALVRDHLGEGGVVSPGALVGGAALMRDDQAWVLADEHPARFLGPAMMWARQQGARQLHLLTETDAGHLARRAAAFADAPMVWQVNGRALSRAEPAPLPDPPPLDPRLVPLFEVISAGGATPVVEHGVLTGEVAGLEVCRAEIDPHRDEVTLGVGVGAHDREAFAIMHGDIPTPEALARVVAAVTPHRQPGADPHPLNRLAAERALRHRLLSEPHLVDAAYLEAAPPPVPRGGVKEVWPAVAVGADAAGRSMVVVCSTGIDPDLVPFAVDARRPDDALVIAVPHRDAHPMTRALVDRVRSGARLVPIA